MICRGVSLGIAGGAGVGLGLGAGLGLGLGGVGVGVGAGGFGMGLGVGAFLCSSIYRFISAWITWRMLSSWASEYAMYPP